MESENLDTCSTILTDALKFIPGEARDLLRNAPRIAIDLQKDNIYLKTSSKSNVGRTDRYIFKFFLERASISDFCCDTNQNNPHILEYDSYDCSRLLQPRGKFFSWAHPIPLGNFYPLAPPPLRNFH